MGVGSLHHSLASDPCSLLLRESLRDCLGLGPLEPIPHTTWHPPVLLWVAGPKPVLWKAHLGKEALPAVPSGPAVGAWGGAWGPGPSN